MFSKVNYDLRSEDGRVLFLPPSPDVDVAQLGEPDVYAESAKQLFPIGTLLWFPGMGRKYRYAKAGTALTGIKLLAYNGNRPPTASGYEDLHGFYGELKVDDVAKAYDAGATELSFTDTVDRVKDAFAGAYLLHIDAARGVCLEDSYVVSGPAAATSDPWKNTIVKLLKPLKYAYVEGDEIIIYFNPYSNIQEHDTLINLHYQTAMGVPPIPVENGHYFWLQTAGSVFIHTNGWTTLCPGYALDSRVAMADAGGGSITTRANAGASSGVEAQRVGEVLCLTGHGYGTALVNLDLDLGH